MRTPETGHAPGRHRITCGMDLLDGTLAHAIDLSEDGTRVTNASEVVWTNTNANGDSLGEACAGFTIAPDAGSTARGATIYSLRDSVAEDLKRSTRGSVRERVLLGKETHATKADASDVQELKLQLNELKQLVEKQNQAGLK